MSLTELQWNELAELLDAAFKLDDYLCEQASRKVYDFTKHDSDWIDLQQLFYLSDPTMFMVTNDIKLRNRIVKKCLGAKRIILLDELLRDVNADLSRGSSW